MAQEVAGGSESVDRANSQRTAFFVSPIGSAGSPARLRSNDLLEFVLRPVLGEFAVDIVRADELEHPGLIGPQVIRLITSADLIVVDLAGRNANVFYELGVADSFGRPVIAFYDGESLPFDVKDVRSIRVSGTEEGPIGAREAEVGRTTFRRYAEAALGSGYRAESIVSLSATQARFDFLIQAAREDDSAASGSDLIVGIGAAVRRVEDQLAELEARSSHSARQASAVKKESAGKITKPAGPKPLTNTARRKWKTRWEGKLLAALEDGTVQAVVKKATQSANALYLPGDASELTKWVAEVVAPTVDGQ